MTAATLVNESSVLFQVKQLVGDVLQLGERTADLNTHTPLLGGLPELDSMAVLTLISALEEYFHFEVADDDDMSGAFSTVDSLVHYVEQKLLN